MKLHSLSLTRPAVWCAALTCVLGPLVAADKKADKKAGLIQDDFPFQKACIGAKFPGKNDANKGIAIRLGTNAAMCFDQDLLRWSAGWTGGFISSKGVTFDGSHGGHPELVGEQHWGLRVQPGWADAAGSFKDPRSEPFGPLPRAWGRVSSLQVHGQEVTLNYEVLGTPIRERAEAIEQDGLTVFVRNLFVGKNPKPLLAALCEVDGAQGKVEGSTATLTAANGQVTTVTLTGAPASAKLELADNSRVLLRIPAGAGGSAFKIALARTDAANTAKVAALSAGAPRFSDANKAGPAHWPDAVVTQGVLAASSTPDGAYVQDVLTRRSPTRGTVACASAAWTSSATASAPRSPPGTATCGS